MARRTKKRERNPEDIFWAFVFLGVVIIMYVFGSPKWEKEREMIEQYNQQLEQQENFEQERNDLIYMMEQDGVNYL
jgi:hypothetical protein